MAHPALKQADQAVWNALREPAGACLLFVFGPTGVGKTTLLPQMEKRLMALAPAPGGAERRPLPALRVDAVSPALNHFKWGDYYQPVPLLRKTMVERAPLPSRRPPDTAALRLAFEHRRTLRQPRAILIDEAEHIAKAARGSTWLDQLDHVKSLAIMTHTVHVLVGTYDLLVFRNLSAQLARRSVDVHFARYRATTEAEVRAFKSVLGAFQRNVPREEEPALLPHWQYCYERTVGCVGVLQDWLTRGLADALERGAKTLSRALLARHALSVDRCEQMLTEAMAGEAALTKDGQAAYRLRVRLGLEPGPAQQHRHQPRGQEPGEDRLPSLAGVHRVGHRKPHRDRGRNPETV